MNQLIAVVSLLFLAACQSSTEPTTIDLPDTIDDPLVVSLDPGSVVLSPGESVDLAVNISGGPSGVSTTILCAATGTGIVQVTTHTGTQECGVTAIGNGPSTATVTAVVTRGNVSNSGAASVTILEGSGGGKSRSDPVGLNEPVEVHHDPVSGEGDIRLTLLELVSGSAALEVVLDANQFNDLPPAGHEYVLGRFRVEVLTTATAGQALGVSGFYWESVTGGGVVEDGAGAVGLDPSFSRSAFAGASYEGWASFFVPIGDGAPTAVFERGSGDEAWFTLR